MSEKTISLQTMLDAIYKVKNKTAKKRLIFDQSNLAGIGSKWVKAFFISLPILLYIGIFNPTMFSMLGIASAVVFYIVFLSMVMIIIAGLTFVNNAKVLRQIEPSWNNLFPNVELKQLLASNGTPYKDFLTHYNQALKDDLKEEALYDRLKENFAQMQDENRELYEQINAHRTRKESQK